MSHTMNRRSRASSCTSKLLNEAENGQLLRLVGNRSVCLAAAVGQVVNAEPPGRNKWTVKCAGVLCFVKDNPKRSYYIRAYDLNTSGIVYEQEIYNQLKYHKKRPYFHTYEGDNCPIGINFANEDEANVFHMAVEEKLQQRKKRRDERRKPGTLPGRTGAPSRPNAPAPVNTGISIPNIPTVAADAGKDTLKKKDKDKDKGKKGKKSKLTKDQIGTPTDFRHVGHVGWDPDKGFDMDNLDPSLKTLFNDIGLSQDQLQDKETANFIYDFIEQHGGVEALKREQTVRQNIPLPVPPPMGNAPPPPPPAVNRGPAAPPPAPSRNLPPPPPPSRAPQSAPPPPPPSRGPGGRGMAAPPPPPPPSRPAAPLPVMGGAAPPPPPPPPAIGGPPAPPPPPPPAFSGGAPPPPPPPAQPDTRNALLSQIQGGTSLKHIDPVEKPAAPSDGRGALMDAIRGGITLNKVDPSEMENRKSSEPSSESALGLAGALARALKDRAKVVQDDDDSDEDEEEDDDEWED